MYLVIATATIAALVVSLIIAEKVYNAGIAHKKTKRDKLLFKSLIFFCFFIPFFGEYILINLLTTYAVIKNGSTVVTEAGYQYKEDRLKVALKLNKEDRLKVALKLNKEENEKHLNKNVAIKKFGSIEYLDLTNNFRISKKIQEQSHKELSGKNHDESIYFNRIKYYSGDLYTENNELLFKGMNNRYDIEPLIPFTRAWLVGYNGDTFYTSKQRELSNYLNKPYLANISQYLILRILFSAVSFLVIFYLISSPTLILIVWWATVLVFSSLPIDEYIKLDNKCIYINKNFEVIKTCQ